MSRIISYAEAICEGTAQEMERDAQVVVIGQESMISRGLLEQQAAWWKNLDPTG